MDELLASLLLTHSRERAGEIRESEEQKREGRKESGTAWGSGGNDSGEVKWSWTRRRLRPQTLVAQGRAKLAADGSRGDAGWSGMQNEEVDLAGLRVHEAEEAGEEDVEEEANPWLE